MGKLTYLGYAGILVTTAAGIFALPIVIYLVATGKLYFAEIVMNLWA